MKIYFEKIENISLNFVRFFSPALSEMLRKKIIILRYLFAGGIATSTDLVFLAMFKEIFGIHYLWSAVFAFVIAFFVSFTMQKFWTFGDTRMEGVHRQMAVYLVVTVANLGLNTLLMYIFVDIFRVWYLLSQILVSGLIALEGFFIYRRFVFKNRGLPVPPQRAIIERFWPI